MGADLHHPHHQAKTRHAVCAIVTVSDTRTPESDASGVCIRALLEEAEHRVLSYTILPDDPGRLRAHLEELFGVPGLDAVIVNGGTGLAPRDTTYEAIAGLLEKRLDGLGGHVVARRRGCGARQDRRLAPRRAGRGRARDAEAPPPRARPPDPPGARLAHAGTPPLLRRAARADGSARRAERRAGNDGRRALARAGRGASGAGRDARALRRERDLRRALAPAG